MRVACWVWAIALPVSIKAIACIVEAAVAYHYRTQNYSLGQQEYGMTVA